MSSVFKIPNGRKSNWETVVFALIRNITHPNYHNIFYRQQIISPIHLDTVLIILRILQHKKFPEHPEETLQRTMQNLRDKNYIKFFGDGTYRLTDEGCAEIHRLKSVIDGINEAIKIIRTKNIK